MPLEHFGLLVDEVVPLMPSLSLRPECHVTTNNFEFGTIANPPKPSRNDQVMPLSA